MCFNKRILTLDVELAPLWNTDKYAGLVKLNVDDCRAEHSTIKKNLIAAFCGSMSTGDALLTGHVRQNIERR